MFSALYETNLLEAFFDLSIFLKFYDSNFAVLRSKHYMIWFSIFNFQYFRRLQDYFCWPSSRRFLLRASKLKHKKKRKIQSLLNLRMLNQRERNVPDFPFLVELFRYKYEMKSETCVTCDLRLLNWISISI